MASFEKVSVQDLGRLWDGGMASGSSVDGDQAFARIKSKLDAKVAERKSQKRCASSRKPSR
ncbi:hypothetical protein [Mesorhizobium sp. M1143]|uniref:hypothetical protein n=1 Tax=Mesorhizobium sp. M1143 TaxID=2957061 RepID=UPI00333BE911